MRQSLLAMMNIALEGAIDGNLHKEIEYTFYGRLKDITQLEAAVRTESHEQWKLTPGKEVEGFRARIREIDHRRWVLCTKQVREGAYGWDEVECDISKDMFTALKVVATNGYRKTRYEFPVAGTDRIWEVDVFVSRSGEPSVWVKIDLEVEDPHAKIPEFPLEFDEIITNQDTQMSGEERAFVDRLWHAEWQQLDA